MYTYVCTYIRTRLAAALAHSRSSRIWMPHHFTPHDMTICVTGGEGRERLGDVVSYLQVIEYRVKEWGSEGVREWSFLGGSNILYFLPPCLRRSLFEDHIQFCDENPSLYLQGTSVLTSLCNNYSSLTHTIAQLLTHSLTHSLTHCLWWPPLQLMLLSKRTKASARQQHSWYV